MPQSAHRNDPARRRDSEQKLEGGVENLKPKQYSLIDMINVIFNEEVSHFRHAACFEFHSTYSIFRALSLAERRLPNSARQPQLMQKILSTSKSSLPSLTRNTEQADRRFADEDIPYDSRLHCLSPSCSNMRSNKSGRISLSLSAMRLYLYRVGDCSPPLVARGTA